MKICSRMLLLLSFVLAGALLANGQQAPQAASPQSQQAQPAAAKPASAKPVPKRPIVWSNDNIDSVRSAADDYRVEQQQAKEAQKVAAQQAEATANNTQSKAGAPQVTSVQQADSMIASKSHDLTGEQSYLQSLQKQVNDPTVTGLERKRLEWRLKSHTATSQALQSEIKQLETERDALAKKAASSNNSSSNSQSQL